MDLESTDKGWCAQLTHEGQGISFVGLGEQYFKREVHVYPQNDLVIHSLHRDCPCAPKISKTADNIYEHNAWDNRESWEELEVN